MFIKHQPDSNTPTDVFRHYLQDVIYGANDGIITTFTIISGVAGAKLSPLIIIILGFVNLFADGVSMGASRFLSIRADARANRNSRGFLEPLYHGVFTFIAFFLFGLVPLLSFLFPVNSENQFFFSCIITACTLFLVGSLQIVISKKHWLRGGFEMLIVGGIVATIAYAVGYTIKDLI